jgi:hypothetical protein
MTTDTLIGFDEWLKSQDSDVMEDLDAYSAKVGWQAALKHDQREIPVIDTKAEYKSIIDGLSVSRELLKEAFPDADTHAKVLGMISLLQFNAEKAVAKATKQQECEIPVIDKNKLAEKIGKCAFDSRLVDYAYTAELWARETLLPMLCPYLKREIVKDNWAKTPHAKLEEVLQRQRLDVSRRLDPTEIEGGQS